jgi:apolipoprotein N-acyltransferase
VVAGLMQAAATAPGSFGQATLWPLTLLSAGWLAARAARSPSAWQAAWLGWLFGIAWLVAGTGWLFISMHRYGGLPAWLSATAVLALSGALSLYLALAMGVFRRLRSGRLAGDALLFAALWTAAEWARGVIFTGFPWAASGYALVDSPLARLAPLIGVYGVGAAAAGAAAVVALADSRRGALAGLASAGVVLATLAAWSGADFTRPAGDLRVTLLQGNVPQDEKFDPDHMLAALTWHTRQLADAGPGLVVAPETAIPLLPQQLPQGYWDELRRLFNRAGHAALVGVPLGDDEQGYTNSVAGLSPQAVRSKAGFYRYDKHHLVPFGEFIPWGFRWFVDLMNMPLGDFSRGPLAPPPFVVGDQRIGPNICYEDLFGEELAARLVDEAMAPTVLANVSNIAWFGRSHAIEQHLLISRMRTLELQRPMIRATNTGATAIVDHTGRVTQALPPHERGVLRGIVQGREGLTPYAWWAGHAGLWPVLGLAVAIVAGAAWRRR